MVNETKAEPTWKQWNCTKLQNVTVCSCHSFRDVTKMKNIRIRRMQIISLLLVEYRMRIANTKY